MDQNKHNFPKDVKLLISNIDTTSERLSSDNTPGIFLKNSFTEKALLNENKNQFNYTATKNQKNTDKLIPKTMRNTPRNAHNNYSNNKEYNLSQKETQEITQKKSNMTSTKNTFKKMENFTKSDNYKTIVKKINMISIEKSRKKSNNIPLGPRKNISKISNNTNDDKNSYQYLNKLKKNYSLNKLKDNNSTYTINNKSKQKNSNNKKNLTANYFYPRTCYRNNYSQNSNKGNNYLSNILYTYSDISYNNKSNKMHRNISPSNLIKINIANNNINDLEEIVKVRNKFNKTYKNFYNNIVQQNSNKKLVRNLTVHNSFKENNIIKNKNNKKYNLYTTSDYSTINSYWNNRSLCTIQKMAQIKNDLFNKEENEIKLIPNINKKSKELAENSDKYNIEFKNIYDRLYYINNLNLNLNIDKQNNINNKSNNHLSINEKSRKMKRTIDDLYLWNNEKEKKIKENEENIFKKTVYIKKNTNLSSEEILKERRPNYLNKKVEDRLIEQGEHQKIKKEKEKEKSIQELTKQKIFINNNYNNIKSRYLEQNTEENKNYRQIENIYNYYNIANMRNDDNFNKKLVYYGDKMNKNSFYYYKQLNKSLNKNKNISPTPKNTENIKSFDGNIFSAVNNINFNSNISKLKDRNNNIFDSRIPKDFTKISRPPSSNNNDIRKNKSNLIKNISNISNAQMILSNNTTNENQKSKTTYFSLLYNDMLNLNSKNNNNNLNDNIKKNEDSKLNLNIKLNNNIDKNESSIKSYLSSLNNINNSEEKMNIIDDKKKEKEDINNNTGKFNYNEFKDINNISNRKNIPMRDNFIFTENNTEEDIINLKEKEQKNLVDNSLRGKSKNYNMKNDILNQITGSISSSNTSKMERRDRRKEDLMKIIDFSDNLYNSQSKKEN